MLHCLQFAGGVAGGGEDLVAGQVAVAEGGGFMFDGEEDWEGERDKKTVSE